VRLSDLTSPASAVLLALLGAGCSGGGESPPVTPAAPDLAVPAELLAQTWQVRLATPAARGAFEGKDGWVAWYQGQPSQAAAAFAAASDVDGLARTHLAYAAMYRQAALVAARASLAVWRDDGVETDPADVSYLLGVSGALLGDADALGRLGAASASKDKAVAARDKAWAAWKASGAAWPPDAVAAGSPGAPAVDVAGPLPDLGVLPHYRLPERTPEALPVDAADPGALWALARWHEAKVQSSPAIAAVAASWLDPWRLGGPDAAVGPVTAAVPDSLLFLSMYTTPADLAYLSALAKDGKAALAAPHPDSPYAAIVAHCTKDGTIGVECVVDQSAALGQALVAAMTAANGGQADGAFRPFADTARLGVFIAADRAAAAAGQDQTMGQLRIDALDRAIGPARDPLFLLSVAAWDTGNRYTTRAEELVHELAPVVPGLDVARLPLDSLHVRLSRNAAPGRPMH